MSKHGRAMFCACGAQFPVNRENLKRKTRFGGQFVCKRCEKRTARTKATR